MFDPFLVSQDSLPEFVIGLRLPARIWDVTEGGATTQIHEGGNLPRSGLAESVGLVVLPTDPLTGQEILLGATDLFFSFRLATPASRFWSLAGGVAGLDFGTRLLALNNVPAGLGIRQTGNPLYPQFDPFGWGRWAKQVQDAILAAGRSLVEAVGRSTLYTSAAGTAVAFGDVYVTGEIKGGALAPANAQEPFLQSPGTLRTPNPLLIFLDQGQGGLFNLSLQQPYNPGGLGGNSRALTERAFDEKFFIRLLMFNRW